MRNRHPQLRRKSRLAIGVTCLLVATALAGASRAATETAAEIEARMAETEAELAARGADMELIADELEAQAMEAERQSREVEAELEAQAMEAERQSREVEAELEEAQVRLEEAAREVAELSARLSGDAVELALRGLDTRRAMLGINIGATPESGSDGVLVMGVTPDGPAERAGLQSGDVITSIDGIDLTGGEPGDGLDRLSTRMKDVAAGEDLQLTVRRGDAAIDFVVAPEEMDPRIMIGFGGGDYSFDFGELQELEALKEFEFHAGAHEGGFAIRLGRAGRWGDMELVNLTPDLGQYFGAGEGLLVVRAPTDAAMGLKDGDVILEIDGRRPSDPAHAMRILGSYDPGERLALDIVRQQQRQQVEIVVPAAEVGSLFHDHGRRLLGAAEGTH